MPASCAAHGSARCRVGRCAVGCSAGWHVDVGGTLQPQLLLRASRAPPRQHPSARVCSSGSSRTEEQQFALIRLRRHLASRACRGYPATAKPAAPGAGHAGQKPPVASMTTNAPAASEAFAHTASSLLGVVDASSMSHATSSQPLATSCRRTPGLIRTLPCKNRAQCARSISVREHPTQRPALTYGLLRPRLQRRPGRHHSPSACSTADSSAEAAD